MVVYSFLMGADLQNKGFNSRLFCGFEKPQILMNTLPISKFLAHKKLNTTKFYGIMYVILVWTFILSKALTNICNQKNLYSFDSVK